MLCVLQFVLQCISWCFCMCLRFIHCHLFQPVWLHSCHCAIIAYFPLLEVAMFCDCEIMAYLYLWKVITCCECSTLSCLPLKSVHVLWLRNFVSISGVWGLKNRWDNNLENCAQFCLEFRPGAVELLEKCFQLRQASWKIASDIAWDLV